MNVEEFYDECEKLLGVKTEYKKANLYIKYDRTTGIKYRVPTPANRWGGREPGNGRFEGKGIIRVFGSLIHIALNNPKLQGHYQSFEDALTAIEIAVNNSPTDNDTLIVTLNNKKYNAKIVGEYDEKQWIVEIEYEYPNGYKTIDKRYVDK